MATAGAPMAAGTRRCPLKEHDYLQHDGLGLARLVAKGEVSAAELLAAARRRADAVNPMINAICVGLGDHADRRGRETLVGPCGGVPFLLKDLDQDLAGFVTSAGCRALAARRAAHTSTAVQR